MEYTHFFTQRCHRSYRPLNTPDHNHQTKTSSLLSMLLDHKFHRTHVWVCFIVSSTSLAICTAYFLTWLCFSVMSKTQNQTAQSHFLFLFVTIRSLFKLTVLLMLKSHKTRFDYCPSRGKLGKT